MPHAGGARVLAAGESVVAPGITRLLLDRVSDRLAPANGQAERLDVLTARERDVLALVAMAKLHLRDRAQAVAFA